MSSNGINLHRIKKDEFELLASAIKVGDLHEYYMDQQVKMRKGTSDLAVAKQIFLNEEYGVALPFEPYTIIDAGANVGYAALYFAARYQSATILAVECDSANFQAMLHNLNGGPGTDQPHPRIIPIMAALWPVDTEVAVIDPGRKEWAMRVVPRFAPGERLPTLYLDAARAIQFARHNANEWHIDPQRIGATGESVGAGASLWLGFHADLANPASDDPVLRESSRLRCLAVNGAQSSYDPRVIRTWIGDAAARHPEIEGFYGLKSHELDTPEAHRRFEAASPITHLTTDAPPVLAFYFEPRGPLPPNAQPGTGFRHINFGLKLKERMDAFSLSCTIRHRDEGANLIRETVGFFVKYLQSPG